MRRKKRIQIVEIPYADPEEVQYVVTKPIPVEIPAPYEPAVVEPEPKKKEEKVNK